MLVILVLWSWSFLHAHVFLDAFHRSSFIGRTFIGRTVIGRTISVQCVKFVIKQIESKQLHISFQSTAQEQIAA
jgi:hypothetical protein